MESGAGLNQQRDLLHSSGSLHPEQIRLVIHVIDLIHTPADQPEMGTILIYYRRNPINKVFHHVLLQFGDSADYIKGIETCLHGSSAVVDDVNSGNGSNSLKLTIYFIIKC